MFKQLIKVISLLLVLCRIAYNIFSPCFDNIRVYLGVRTPEVFLCFIVIVRARVYHVDFFVFLVLRHW